VIAEVSSETNQKKAVYTVVSQDPEGGMRSLAFIGRRLAALLLVLGVVSI